MKTQSITVIPVSVRYYPPSHADYTFNVLNTVTKEKLPSDEINLFTACKVISPQKFYEKQAAFDFRATYFKTYANLEFCIC